MKIAMTHVDLPNESKGGVAHQAHYLANALVDRGHEVTLFSFSPPDISCRYQVHQYSLAPQLRKLQAFVFALKLAATDFSKFDVLHTHGDNYWLWRQHPQIRTFHGSARDEASSAVRWQRRVYQSLMAQIEQISAYVADVNIGVSQTTQYRIPRISTLIPCGVDLDRFRPGIKSQHPTILFVGTADGRKRGQFLADCFNLEVRSQIPEAELWAVSDRPLQGPGVVNFGRVSLEKLCALYQQAWVFCLPSTYEGFGVPYIEAMASGAAVVASPNPGAREVLDREQYGLIVHDWELGQKLLLLLSDYNERCKYIERGLQRARDFSWERVAIQYEQIYQALVEKKAKSVPWEKSTVINSGVS